ncbi:MAG: hypothetical protein GXO10_07190 [Crenarchaeota archaeon]|nr:hypothetical protein [Thermoproteota archaeon]
MKRGKGLAPILASLMLVSLSIIACIILSFWILTLSSDSSMVVQAVSHVPRSLVIAAYVNKSSNSIDVFSIDENSLGRFIICVDSENRVVIYEGTDRGWAPKYVGGGVYLYVIPITKELKSGVYYCKLLLDDGELIIFRLVVY